jgi:hypothetical protein
MSSAVIADAARINAAPQTSSRFSFSPCSVEVRFLRGFLGAAERRLGVDCHDKQMELSATANLYQKQIEHHTLLAASNSAILRFRSSASLIAASRSFSASSRSFVRFCTRRCKTSSGAPASFPATVALVTVTVLGGLGFRV